MAAGAHYTADDLERALALHDSGLTWRTIGQRFGRSHRSLAITANQYRKGTWAPYRLAERTAARDQRIEELVASGVTSINAIARDLGISSPGACHRLMRLGLDAEMRREAARPSPRS